jgi:hypothetical protein
MKGLLPMLIAVSIVGCALTLTGASEKVKIADI